MANQAYGGVDVHTSIAAALYQFGGELRCMNCGYRTELGSIGDRLRNGWPVHCSGYTMRWVTARQMAEESRATAKSS